MRFNRLWGNLGPKLPQTDYILVCMIKGGNDGRNDQFVHKSIKALKEKKGMRWEHLLRWKKCVPVDGTLKYLFRTPAHNFIEAVYIPDEDRSYSLRFPRKWDAQMNCKFCKWPGLKVLQLIWVPSNIKTRSILFLKREKLIILFSWYGRAFRQSGWGVESAWDSDFRIWLQFDLKHCFFNGFKEKDRSAFWMKVIVIWLSVYILRFLRNERDLMPAEKAFFHYGNYWYIA